MISTKDIKPLEINNGYAKRYDGIAKLNTSKENGETTISIFSALKRNFPMKIDMMENILRKSSIHTNERNDFFSICST